MTQTPPSPSDSPVPDSVDPVLDVLLDEVLGDRSPPDQSDVILRRYRDATPDSAVVRTKSKKVNATKESRKKPFSFWTSSLALVAGILVVAGIATGLRSQLNEMRVANAPRPLSPDSGRRRIPLSPSRSLQSIAGSDSPENTNGPPQAVPASTDDEGLTGRTIEPAGATSRDSMKSLDTLAASDTHKNSIGQASPSGPKIASLDSSASPTEPPEKKSAKTNLQPGSLKSVSRDINLHLVRYWDRIHVEPTELLPAAQTAKRLWHRLHLRLSPRAINNSWVLRNELQGSQNLEALATRLLQELTPGADLPANHPNTQALSQQLQETMRRGKGADELLVTWLTKTDKKGLVPLSPQLQTLDPHAAIVSLSALTSNFDRRCQRCHDLPPIGQPVVTQADYREFHANISPILSAGKQKDSPSQAFLHTQATADLETMGQLWLGSRGLASGMVDWVWRTVHGRSLVSSPYDLRGAADDDIKALHDELANDLIASDFNLLRTITLVMNEFIVGRRPPAAMNRDRIMMAGNVEWTQALLAVDSFAAAAPDSQPSSPSQRLNMVAKAVQARTGTRGSGQTILAQPMGSEDIPADQRQSSQSASAPEVPAAVLAGMPVRASVVMPGWINQLPTFESRRDHIAHLAGKTQLTGSIVRLADQMQKAGDDEALILQRIWWIIQGQE
ncbi:hypothetical protein [Neorhodopirellula lusitana]|uniref:hypothetical protein n=1 Tax=Neorhodopirellula lusitana TaxID=445327 RepID=UPI00384BA40A